MLIAAAAGLLLTIARPSPTHLLRLGDNAVRAAPWTPPSTDKSHYNLSALPILKLTLVRLSQSYVDRKRIDPKKMLYAALDSVQFNIPEVLVNSNPATSEIVVVVNDKQRSFSASKVDAPWRFAGKIKEIFRFIEANINPRNDLAKVEYAAINGMLRTLDPHSLLLDPEMAREMDVNTSGKFGGLGIVIGMRKRKLTVIRPMKGTPAFQAGIKARDYIMKIDDETTDHLTLSESVGRMRGDPGTPVTLAISRDGEKGLLSVSIVRDMIRVPSLISKLLPGNVGYIRIKQFAVRTAAELHTAMARLSQQGARAWLLDLRWNPGGLLEQAIRVSDAFLDQGTIVSTVTGTQREPRRASRKGTDTQHPVAVLVNGY